MGGLNRLHRFGAVEKLFKAMLFYYSMQKMSAKKRNNNANQQEARNYSIVGLLQSEAVCSMTDPRKNLSIVII